MRSSIYLPPIVFAAIVAVVVGQSNAGRPDSLPESRSNIVSPPESRPTGLPTILPHTNLERNKRDSSVSRLLGKRTNSNERNRAQNDQPTHAPHEQKPIFRIGILGAQAQAYNIIDDSEDWDMNKDELHPILSSYYDNNPEEDLNSLLKETTEDPIFEESDEGSTNDDTVGESFDETQTEPAEIEGFESRRKTYGDQLEVSTKLSNERESVVTQNTKEIHDSTSTILNDGKVTESVVVIEDATTEPIPTARYVNEAGIPKANISIVSNAESLLQKPTVHSTTLANEYNSVDITESTPVEKEELKSAPLAPKSTGTFQSKAKDEPETLVSRNTNNPTKHSSTKTPQATPSSVPSIVPNPAAPEEITDPVSPAPDSFQKEPLTSNSTKRPQPEPSRPESLESDSIKPALPEPESSKSESSAREPPEIKSHQPEPIKPDSSRPDLPQPESSATEPPQLKSPELEPPQLKSPEPEPPQLKSPEPEPPQLKSPEPEPPQLKSPEPSNPESPNLEDVKGAHQVIQLQDQLERPGNQINESETIVLKLSQMDKSSESVATQSERPTPEARAGHRQSRLDRESLKLTSQSPEMRTTESYNVEVSSASVSTEDTRATKDELSPDNSEDQKLIDESMVAESTSEPFEIDYSLIGVTMFCVVFVSIVKIGKLLFQTKSAIKMDLSKGSNSELKNEVESLRDSLRTVKKDLRLDVQSNLQEYVKNLRATNLKLSRLVDQQNKLLPVREAINSLKESFGGDPETKIVDRRRYLQNLKLGRVLEEKNVELKHKIKLSKCQQLMMIKNFVKLDDLLDLMKHIEIDEISKRLSEATFELKVQHDLYKEWLGDLRNFGKKFKNDYDELDREISQEKERDLATEVEISKLWEQCDQLELSDSIDDLKRKVADKAAETDKYYKDYINNYYWLHL